MQSLIALYFFILATIQVGLLTGLLHYYQPSNTVKPSPYWLASLGASICALAIFGAGLFFANSTSRPPFGFTLANTFFYIAAASQLLFCKSLSTEISSKFANYTKVSIVIFFFVFEFLRQNTSFEARTIFIVVLLFILFSLQIYELKKIKKRNASKLLTYLQYVNILELFFSLCRLAILVTNASVIHKVEQIPESLIFYTIGQLTANTISYIVIGGYWAEKIALSNAQATSENELIKELLVERENLISHLSTANKTAMTGALSASIAHELNQPIAAIQLNTQFFQAQLASGNLNLETLRDVAKSIESDNIRIANIVSTLRGIFKEERMSTQLIDLNTIIDAVTPIVLPQARNQNIQLRFDQQSHQSLALNAGELQQVFLNLINNAIDALSDLRTSDKIILIKTRDLDGFVEMSISDNGGGVHRELVPSLFELMKTNKKSGMGFGLWLTRHIVERHQGKITYQTSSMGGAEFVIRLPLELV